MSTQPSSSPDYSRVSDTNGLAALRVGAAQSMAYHAAREASAAAERRISEDVKRVLEQHQLREVATGGLHGTFVVCTCQERIRMLSEWSIAEAMAEHQVQMLQGAVR